MFNTAFDTEIQALEVLGDISAGIVKREEAIRFLGRHPSLPSIHALIDSLEDDDFGVRWEAATILAQYGELSIPPLLDALTDPERVSCPRLRDGAYQVLENNASTLIVALSASLRKALKGPAADIATMQSAFRLQQRLKRLHLPLEWPAAGRQVSWRPQKAGLQDHPIDRKNFNLVTFYARDPYNQEANELELEWFIRRFHDVWDWKMRPDGQVWVQYDPSGISDEMIEEVLARNGYEIQHIADVSGGFIQ